MKSVIYYRLVVLIEYDYTIYWIFLVRSIRIGVDMFRGVDYDLRDPSRTLEKKMRTTTDNWRKNSFIRNINLAFITKTSFVSSCLSLII